MNGNLLFITGCYPKELEHYFVKESKVMPQNAANVLSWRIIEGLEKNIPQRFQVLTCPFIGYYPKGFKRLFIKNSKWSHNDKDEDRLLGFINIKGLETLIKSEKIYKFVKKWYKKSKKNRYILIYSHYAGFMRAVGKIRKKMPDLHISCIVTDMNELDERKDLNGVWGKIKGFPRKLMIDTTYKNLKYINSFVLLAEKMKDYLGVGERPYVVVEGIAAGMQNRCNHELNENMNRFRVVYTGTLHKRYGVLTLAQAMKHLQDENVDLYICGAGDGAEELKMMSEKSENIYYLGVLRHAEAIALQNSSSLLVNSMPNFGIHTALSFPSKTMEYMLMGKPVACFKVDGIPSEYDDYLTYFPSYEAECIAEVIRVFLRMSKEELEIIGERNRQFVLERKNPKIQTEKILKMIGIKI